MDIKSTTIPLQPCLLLTTRYAATDPPKCAHTVYTRRPAGFSWRGYPPLTVNHKASGRRGTKEYRSWKCLCVVRPYPLLIILVGKILIHINPGRNAVRIQNQLAWVWSDGKSAYETECSGSLHPLHPRTDGMGWGPSRAYMNIYCNHAPI